MTPFISVTPRFICAWWKVDELIRLAEKRISHYRRLIARPMKKAYENYCVFPVGYGASAMAKQLALIEDEGHDRGIRTGNRVSYAGRLIRQGRHRFYTLTMPSDVLAETCVVDTREENPDEGFQRLLDENRAQEIAEYIDQGFGTIPCSIVLSAQPEANLDYNSRTQVLSFKKARRAFLILDGQHRVFGFKRAQTRLRVPVVIYNGLRKAEEARLFIDINTKQRLCQMNFFSILREWRKPKPTSKHSCAMYLIYSRSRKIVRS